MAHPSFYLLTVGVITAGKTTIQFNKQHPSSGQKLVVTQPAFHKKFAYVRYFHRLYVTITRYG